MKAKAQQQVRSTPYMHWTFKPAIHLLAQSYGIKLLVLIVYQILSVMIERYKWIRSVCMLNIILKFENRFEYSVAEVFQAEKMFLTCMAVNQSSGRWHLLFSSSTAFCSNNFRWSRLGVTTAPKAHWALMEEGTDELRGKSVQDVIVGL